jgi:hypothetical protein
MKCTASNRWHFSAAVTFLKYLCFTLVGAAVRSTKQQHVWWFVYLTCLKMFQITISWLVGWSASYSTSWPTKHVSLNKTFFGCLQKIGKITAQVKPFVWVRFIVWSHNNFRNIQTPFIYIVAIHILLMTAAHLQMWELQENIIAGKLRIILYEY